MKRRTFFKRSMPLTLPLWVGGFPINVSGHSLFDSLAATAGETDRVLVLIQLNGGNDGLNTIIPLDQYQNLSKVRTNVLIPENQVLSLNGKLGLHPSMTGMLELSNQDKLCIVQSVGYPNPNLSHFRSTDIWTSASSAEEIVNSGWLGRYLEQKFEGFPEGYPNEEMPDPLSLTIGPIVSTTCQGPVNNMGLAITSTEAFSQLLTGGVDEAPDTPAGHELIYVRQIIQQTQVYLETIQNAASKASNLSSFYPEPGQNNLADQLKIVAQLIAGGLQTKVYIVNIGGFDTHANQVDQGNSLQGAHADLLNRLSEAVFAFQDDLEKLGVEDQVLGMTFSEFGRRIGSNSSFGTDHGAAAPQFLFGTNVNPIILGQNPQIPSQVGPQDNVPMQYDFRSLYASILADWFEVTGEDLQNVMFEEFQHLPIIGRITDIPEPPDSSLSLYNYPNPFVGRTTIRFESKGVPLQLSIFNGQGAQIQEITNRTYSPGTHEIPFDSGELAAGVYFLRLQDTKQSQMRKMVIADR